jgi:hypothetical protein
VSSSAILCHDIVSAMAEFQRISAFLLNRMTRFLHQQRLTSNPRQTYNNVSHHFGFQGAEPLGVVWSGAPIKKPRVSHSAAAGRIGCQADRTAQLKNHDVVMSESAGIAQKA